MKLHRTCLLVIAAGCCIMRASALAEEKSWVGEMVLPTKLAGDIKFGDRVDGKDVDFPYNGRFPVRVREERDGKLRIHDGHREGWVSKSDFVLGRDGPAYFHRRVQADPKDVFALHMRGSGWLQKGEADNAIQDFNECIRLNPTDASAYNSRGNAYTLKRQFDKAIKDYDEAVHLDEKHVLAFANRGRAYHAQKEYDKAISDYSDAIRLDPTYAPLWSERAFVRRAKNENDKAIADHSEAIRLDPANAIFLSDRASLRHAMKEFDKAIKDYDEALRLEPKNVFALNDRAHSFCGKGEHARAIVDCDAAIAINPKYAWAHHIRATAQLLLRRKEAAKGFQDVIDLEQGKGILSPYAVIMGYFSLRYAGDEDAARKFLKDGAAKLNDAWPYAVIRFLNGELDEVALLKLAADNDMRTVARCFLGMDHALHGRNEQALAHLRWVKENGSTTWVQFTVAVAELSRLERAAK